MMSKKRKYELIEDEVQESFFNTAPNEILVEILMFVVLTNYNELLKLRLINKSFYRIIETISDTLLTNIYGLLKDNILKKTNTNNTNSFFKLTKQEFKRTAITKRYLLELAGFTNAVVQLPTHYNLFGLLDAEKFNPESLSSLKKYMQDEILVFDESPFLTNQYIPKDCISLPNKLQIYLTNLVKAHAYEAIEHLINTINKDYSKTISSDRIIDYIYRHVAREYKAEELIQILNLIPIDLNRQISDPINGMGGGSSYRCKPFLHLAINFTNLEIVKYLVENNVNLAQESSDGKTIADQIQYTRAQLKDCTWLKKEQKVEQLKNLSDIETYLTTNVTNVVLMNVT